MKNLSKWILGNYFQISIFRVIQVKNGGEIKNEHSGGFKFEIPEILKWYKVKLNIGDFKEKEEKRHQQKNRNARFGDLERLDRPNPKSFKGKIIMNDSPEDINDIDRDFYA